MVLSDPCSGGASVKELKLEGFVKVVASEVELIADKGTRGATINKGGEYLGRGGLTVKELEGVWSGEASEVVGSEHCQGFIDEVIHGAAVD
ncbi:hypothetical protein C0989_000534 [Termitomyces sp. Mn162]|nr:hypothetical protein C0989_000534 [Termitomyces sp. Mn162]